MKRKQVHWSFNPKVFIEGFKIGDQVNTDLLEDKQRKRVLATGMIKVETLGTLIIYRRIK